MYQTGPTYHRKSEESETNYPSINHVNNNRYQYHHDRNYDRTSKLLDERNYDRRRDDKYSNYPSSYHDHEVHEQSQEFSGHHANERVDRRSENYTHDRRNEHKYQRTDHERSNLFESTNGNSRAGRHDAAIVNNRNSNRYSNGYSNENNQMNGHRRHVHKVNHAQDRAHYENSRPSETKVPQGYQNVPGNRINGQDPEFYRSGHSDHHNRGHDRVYMRPTNGHSRDHYDQTDQHTYKRTDSNSNRYRYEEPDQEREQYHGQFHERHERQQRQERHEPHEPEPDPDPGPMPFHPRQPKLLNGHEFENTRNDNRTETTARINSKVAKYTNSSQLNDLKSRQAKVFQTIEKQRQNQQPSAFTDKAVMEGGIEQFLEIVDRCDWDCEKILGAQDEDGGFLFG